VIRQLLAVRNAIAVAVMAAAVLSLGADLAQTAYAAAHTAQTVVLAAANV
jgi:hypothetical protein